MKIEYLNYLLNNGINGSTAINIISLDERIVARITKIKEERKLKIIAKYIFNIVSTGRNIDDTVILINHLMNVDIAYLKTICILASNINFCNNHTLNNQLLLFNQLQFCSPTKLNLLIKLLCNSNILMYCNVLEQVKILEYFNRTEDIDILNEVLEVAINEDLCKNNDFDNQVKLIENIFTDNKKYEKILKK